MKKLFLTLALMLTFALNANAAPCGVPNQPCGPKPPCAEQAKPPVAPPETPQGPPPGCQKPPFPPPCFLLAPDLADRLNLTCEQVQKLNQIKCDTIKEVLPLKKDVFEGRCKVKALQAAKINDIRALEAMLDKYDADKAALKKAKKDLEADKADLRKIKKETISKVDAILTKEQKTEFKKFIEEKEAERARFKRHCEEFGPPCGPCPPPGVGCPPPPGVGCPPPPAVNCPPPCAQPEIKCPCGCAPDCKCKQNGKCTCTKERCNCRK